MLYRSSALIFMPMEAMSSETNCLIMEGIHIPSVADAVRMKLKKKEKVIVLTILNVMRLLLSV